MKKFILVILVTLIFTISCAHSGPSGISPYAIHSYSVTEDSTLEFYEGSVDVTKITFKLIKARDKSEELFTLSNEVLITDLETLQLGKNTIEANYHETKLSVEITVLELPHVHNYCSGCNKCLDCDQCICEEEKKEHTLCLECNKCIDEDCDCLDKCSGHLEATHSLCSDCGKCISLDCPCENKCLGHDDANCSKLCSICARCIDEACTHDGKCYGHEEVKSPILFNTVSGHSYLKDEIEAAFYSRDSYNSEYHYSGFANYIPSDISKRFAIAATIIYSEYRDEYSYYIYYNHKLYNVDRIGADPDASYRGFVQFAITDLNNDGFIELLASYHLENNININYLSAFDTKSEQMVQPFGIYDEYVFFKMNGDTLAMYTSQNNNINNATTHYSDVVVNNKKYIFNQKSYHLECDTYEVDVTIDEHTINFPIIFKGVTLNYDVYTAMKYLGKTFTYTNGSSYLDGACPQFGGIKQEGEMALTVITTFVIWNGRVVEQQYRFVDNLVINNQEGTYDMTISYRFADEVITVEDVLTIQIQ